MKKSEVTSTKSEVETEPDLKLQTSDFRLELAAARHRLRLRRRDRQQRAAALCARFSDVLAAEGVTLTEARRTTRATSDSTMSGAFRRWRGPRRDWTAADIDDLIARKSGHGSKRSSRTSSMLFPGAADAIRRAAAAVPIAIASGALGAEIRRVLDREQLTAVVHRDRRGRRHAAQQAGARSVSARGRAARRAVRRPVCCRATASRSRIRSGASSRRARPDCARWPWRTPTTGHALATADLVIVALLDT